MLIQQNKTQSTILRFKHEIYLQEKLQQTRFEPVLTEAIMRGIVIIKQATTQITNTSPNLGRLKRERNIFSTFSDSVACEATCELNL